MRSILLLLILTPIFCAAQQRIANEIQLLEKNGVKFAPVSLVSLQSEDIGRYPGLNAIQEGAILDLDLSAISDLKSQGTQFISLTLPAAGRRSMTLDLMEVDVLAPDFKAYTSDDPFHPKPYTGAKHYRGIIHGDAGSIVALSVFNDEIMGLISTQQGTFVLGKIRNSREHLHILYNDADLVGKPGWECGTPDDGQGYTKEQLMEQIGSRDPGDCVRVYIEIDDDIVTDKGGATNAINFITGLLTSPLRCMRMKASI
jgi:hypothetical protein